MGAGYAESVQSTVDVSAEKHTLSAIDAKSPRENVGSAKDV